MRPSLTVPLLLSLALALLVPGAASAATIGLGATMDCMQANAGAGTCGAGGSGNGTATITLDTDTNLLSWDISWSGLSATEILMHFHGPALPNQNAGVQVTLDHTSNPSIGNQVISAGQATDLLAGLWYINLHTTAFGGGEIRGQVTVPEPGSLALLGFAVCMATALGRRRV